MRKAEFRSRLRDLGYEFGGFIEEHGLSETTWHNWREIPVGYVWWLMLKECEERGRLVVAILGAKKSPNDPI